MNAELLKKYMDITPEVANAIAEGKPVVALESTILSHGMPYPENVAFAAEVEKVIRAEGAIPATLAIIDGRLKAGLTEEELAERDKLRRIYIDSYKANLVSQLENTYIVQPDGTKVKVKHK